MKIKNWHLGIICIIILICASLCNRLIYPKTQQEYSFEERMFQVTAYCACKICCRQYADGITASGYKLRGDNKLCATKTT